MSINIGNTVFAVTLNKYWSTSVCPKCRGKKNVFVGGNEYRCSTCGGSGKTSNYIITGTLVIKGTVSCINYDKVDRSIIESYTISKVGKISPELVTENEEAAKKIARSILTKKEFMGYKVIAEKSSN